MDINVSVCTPSTGIVTADYTISLLEMVIHYFSHPILGQEEAKRGLSHQVVLSACIGQARDDMSEIALKNGATHILFIDDDMQFAPNCLNIALSRQQPVVIANYRRKAPPCCFTAQREGPIQTTKDSTSLEECHFGGFGFALIERQVIEKLEWPRFLAYSIPGVHTYTTEDLPFFEACHKAGFKTYVDHEVSKRVAHVGRYIFNYDDDQIMNSKARNRKEST